MNDISEVENKTSALVSLDPEAYTAAVFAPFEKRLAEAKILVQETPPYDITTKSGLSVATNLRALFRKIRTEGDAERKARTAPITKIQKRLIEVFDELKSKISEFEDRFDAEIKAEGERQQRIADEKKREEEARISALEDKVRIISSHSALAAGKSPDEILAIRSSVMAIDPTEEEYSELAGAALRVQRETLVDLDRLYNAALEQQRKDEEAERTRIELEELRRQNQRIEKAAQVRERISSMRNLAQFDTSDPSSSAINNRLNSAHEIVIDDASFDDQIEIAELVKAGIVEKLNLLLAEATAREENIRKVRKEEEEKQIAEKKKLEEMQKENMRLLEELQRANARQQSIEPAVADDPESENELEHALTPALRIVNLDEKSEQQAPVSQPEAIASDSGQSPAYIGEPAAAASYEEYERPDDAMMIHVVAQHFSVPFEVALEWVSEIGFDDLRVNFVPNI